MGRRTTSGNGLSIFLQAGQLRQTCPNLPGRRLSRRLPHLAYLTTRPNLQTRSGDGDRHRNAGRSDSVAREPLPENRPRLSWVSLDVARINRQWYPHPADAHDHMPIQTLPIIKKIFVDLLR